MRRNTRAVKAGDVYIGGGDPITVQSMANVPTSDRDAVLAQLLELEAAGCQIVRVAVNNKEAVSNIAFLRERVGIPIVADIHFDHRLAIESAAAGISKIRINPGNIGSRDKIKKVADACRTRGIPIRIGINSGSLERELLAKYGAPTPEALCESALAAAAELERADFGDIVLSVKSSDVVTMIKANRLIAAACDYPLHLGVTETGTAAIGTIKSAIGIGALLADGIGDTVRVSLTDHPVTEIKAARDILKAAGVTGGVNLISCPTCGRTGMDLIGMANRLQTEIESVKTEKRINVALMGCIVNGPGEAREADVGVAGSGKEAVLFKKGKIIKKLPPDEVIDTLLAEIKTIAEEK